MSVSAQSVPAPTSAGRIDWVDYAKGVCIILVVMMHSTLGVEKALGETTWLNGFIEWARPFRMPDFFLISGLFLASRIDRPWRAYLDTKVVHFAYFYLLWLTIAFVLKAPVFTAQYGAEETARLYLTSFVQPLGTLWFIYLLAIFFVVTKLLRGLPALATWLAAAALQSMNIDTGWMVIDEFAGRYVYFFTGYIMAPHVFAFARHLGNRPAHVLAAGLVLWAVGNGWFVAHGLAHLPGISLALGFVGALAVVTLAVLLVRVGLFSAVRLCGERSLVIYLSFFVFMAAARIALLRLAPELDGGMIALIVTTCGVAGPLVLHMIVRNGPLRFLFDRPLRFRLTRPIMTARKTA